MLILINHLSPIFAIRILFSCSVARQIVVLPTILCANCQASSSSRLGSRAANIFSFGPHPASSTSVDSELISALEYLLGSTPRVAHPPTPSATAIEFGATKHASSPPLNAFGGSGIYFLKRSNHAQRQTKKNTLHQCAASDNSSESLDGAPEPKDMIGVLRPLTVLFCNMFPLFSKQQAATAAILNGLFLSAYM